MYQKVNLKDDIAQKFQKEIIDSGKLDKIIETKQTDKQTELDKKRVNQLNTRRGSQNPRAAALLRQVSINSRKLQSEKSNFNSNGSEIVEEDSDERSSCDSNNSLQLDNDKNGIKFKTAGHKIIE